MREALSTCRKLPVPPLVQQSRTRVIFAASILDISQPAAVPSRSARPHLPAKPGFKPRPASCPRWGPAPQAGGSGLLSHSWWWPRATAKGSQTPACSAEGKPARVFESAPSLQWNQLLNKHWCLHKKHWLCNISHYFSFRDLGAAAQHTKSLQTSSFQGCV